MPIDETDNSNSVISGLQSIQTYVADTVTTVVQNYDVTCLETAWQRITTQLSVIGDQVQDGTATFFSNAMVFLQENELLQWTKALTEGAATRYDEAMDDLYIKTHLGGAQHRLFDSGHTIVGSWKAGYNIPEEEATLIHWARAYLKDLTTPMGMPFATLEHNSYRDWADNFEGRIPGIDKKYLYDLVTFDVMEIIATGFSVAAVCFAFNTQDQEKLANILGAMGISSITAANPILGLVTIIVTAYAYWKHRSIDLAAMLKGGALTAFSAFMFSIIGLPVLVELAIVLSLSIILKKHIFDNNEFVVWLKDRIIESFNRASDSLNSQTLHLFIASNSSSRNESCP